MYVYIVPAHAAETARSAMSRPFDVRLRIGYGGVPFGDMHYRINQWSGASLEIKLRNDGKPFRRRVRRPRRYATGPSFDGPVGVYLREHSLIAERSAIRRSSA